MVVTNGVWVAVGVMPVTDKEALLLPFTHIKLIIPDRVATAPGVACTCILQLAPAAKVGPQPFVPIEKSEALVPDIVAEQLNAVEAPEFVTIIGTCPEEVPLGTLEKFLEVGLNVRVVAE
jgi:hypothetical protein